LKGAGEIGAYAKVAEPHASWFGGMILRQRVLREAADR